MSDPRWIEEVALGVDAEGSSTVLALASDGTLWEGYRKPDYGNLDKNGHPRYVFAWVQLPPLPPVGEEGK